MEGKKIIVESAVDNLIQVPDGRIAAHAFGRLGNQMFIAAAALTYARRSGRKFIGMTKSDADWIYPEYLMNTVMKKVSWIEDTSQLDGFYKPAHGMWLCNGFPNTDIKDIWMFDFFQDARCIDKDIAYDLFLPGDDVISRLTEMYGDLSDTVCINVRRCDYLRILSLMNVLSKEEIERMMRDVFPGEKFIFVSDDIRWCKNNFKGENIRFADKGENLPWPEKAELDLYIQGMCKGNIISDSTFSWWGAYLNRNGGKVVCHWPWFKPHSGKKMDHVLPEGWIKYT